MEIKLDWSKLKDRVNAKALLLQYVDRDNDYLCWAEDGHVLIYCELVKDATPEPEQVEFETFYAPFANEINQQIVWDEHNPEVQGFYQGFGDKLTVAATPGKQTFDYTFDKTIAFYSGAFTSTSDNKDDVVRVEAMPQTVVGALGAGCSVDDKTFTVSDTAVGFFSKHIGFDCYLIEGANISYLGIVESVDIENSTITTSEGASYAHSAASPTYVAMTAVPVPQFTLHGQGKEGIGENMTGGSLLPKGEKLRFIYDNKDGLAKELYWKLEYRY